MSESRRTSYGYRAWIRARHSPVIVKHNITGKLIAIADEWVEIPSDSGGTVPNQLYCRVASEDVGLLAYATAHALIASLAAEFDAFSRVEFRLEKVRVEYEIKAISVGFAEPMRFDFETERQVAFVGEEETS